MRLRIYCLMIGALSVFIGAKSNAQIITINENLDTSTSTFYFDTNSPRLNVGTDTYSGGVPGVALFVGSNTVIGTGTGSKSEVVIYATGTITLNGVQVATGTLTTGPAGPSGPSGAASTVTVRAVVDNFLGSVNGSQATFTLTQSPASTSAVECILDGLQQYNPTDYSLSGTVITFVTAPASNSSEFFCKYDVYTSTQMGLITSGSGAGGELSGTYPNPTLSGTHAGQFTVTSTITVQGNAFSVGGSTFVVSGGSATISYGLTAQTITVSSSVVNGNLYNGWEQVSLQNNSASNLSVNCSAGKQALGGGCNTNGTMQASYPGVAGWNCGTTGLSVIIAWVICMRTF